VVWEPVLLGLSGKYSDSCDDDSLAASTFECKAGSGRAWIGKCGREGEDCTNMVCMKVAMLFERGLCMLGCLIPCSAVVCHAHSVSR
jgi:hypothetical protein